MVSSLFYQEELSNRRSVEPLAVRMRPQTLDEFIGQDHFIGEGKLLRRLLLADRLGSVIFHGPPGTGKTTLAYILARSSRSIFRQLSAVSDGVKQLREILTEAEERLAADKQKTLLFIDEIHRFNKAQQDVLLPEVENGIIALVGATTENPYFTINNALLSRSRIFQFETLTHEQVKELVRRAATDNERGLGKYKINLHEDALDFLAESSEGDARRAIGALEIGVLSSGIGIDKVDNVDNKVGNKVDDKVDNKVDNKIDNKIDDKVVSGGGVLEFTLELACESVQKKVMLYDRNGDAHYDTISALIKSIRGSDPDAAIYWLAKMLVGGEDIRFLARRLVILASEDVGNADPAALSLAVATAQACELVGLPECQLNLAQAVIYLACAPKSNSATNAIYEAKDDVETNRVIPVPRHLRDAHYKGAEAMGHVGYVYAHNSKNAIAKQEYLGVEKNYYKPAERGFEIELAKRLEWIKQQLKENTD
ncbi:MAG: replication-associated recombination protein A [Planctomycetaceae bacterium]|nr:replication-associated recombination protein A [Planctomycetaceae bacterium]